MKRKLCAGLGVLLAVSLTACQKSPDSSLVVNKDMDKLVEAAQNTGTAAGMEDFKEYDSYQTTIKDENLGIDVTVDAKVDIPETNQMSVIRVGQTKITQELLDKVKENLFDGQTVYDGSMLSVRKRSDIEQEIQELKSQLANLESGNYSQEELDSVGGDPELAKQNAEVTKAELQERINELQTAYENAPATVDLQDYISDGQIKRVADRDASSEFYSWQQELNPDGEDYYGATDGADGTYRSIFVQNSDDYGNCLRYRSGKHGYEFTAYANIGATDMSLLKKGTSYGGNNYRIGLESAGGVDALVNSIDGGRSDKAGSITTEELTDEPTTLSLKEAVAVADAFIEEIGLTDFQYMDGDLAYEEQDIRSQCDYDTESAIHYRKEYILQYMRNIDGAFTTSGESKHEEGWSGDSYVKKEWSPESIVFRINDSGIVGFDYNAPLEVQDTVVENASMKSFDEIKTTFEKMIAITKAPDNSGYEEIVNTRSIKVDRVVLGYARVSEANSYDTGLLVPVWDFYGTVTDNAWGITNYESVMTINAIDGSLIDRTLGY